MKTSFNSYFSINKYEEQADGTLFVKGVASTEALDSDLEKISSEAMKNALPEFMKFGTGNLREMHQPIAAGTVDAAAVEDGVTTIECTVVDPVAIKKVQTGVYKGFSIGGKSLKKEGNLITGIKLGEISLVDRPANPESLITLWKSEEAVEKDEQKNDNEEPSDEQKNLVNKLADMLDSGETTLEHVFDSLEKNKPGVVKKYAGEEIDDAANAITALGFISLILQKEQSENEINADQVNALQIALEAVKSFIASEIMEDNSEEKSEETTGLQKAGKVISSKNMQKLQELHDSLKGLGVACQEPAEKLEKAEKETQAETEIQKLAQTVMSLKQDIDILKSQKPAPGKAFLRAVSKEEDAGIEKSFKKVEPVFTAKGEVNEVASLIKQIHSKV